jgi:hypothetical protein
VPSYTFGMPTLKRNLHLVAENERVLYVVYDSGDNIEEIQTKH